MDEPEVPMVPVYRASKVPNAALIVQWLEGHGIPARRVGGNTAIGYGELGAESLNIEVWAAEERADDARAEIRRFFTDSAHEEPGRGPWTCPACNGLNDTGFDLCWSCQAARPEAS